MLLAPDNHTLATLMFCLFRSYLIENRAVFAILGHASRTVLAVVAIEPQAKSHRKTWDKKAWSGT